MPALTLLNGQFFFVKVTDMHLRKKHLFQELPFIKTIMMFTVFGRDQYRNTPIYKNQYTNLQEIMGWKSSDVFRFDLGAFFKVK